VTKAVAVAAEAATKSADKENDEDDNEDSSDRHRLVSVPGTQLNIGLRGGNSDFGFRRLTPYRGRHPENTKLLFLDAAVADVVFHRSGILSLPIELISEGDHDGERAEDEIENVPIHRPIFCCFALDARAFVANLP
jgi:hypothetical protein